MDKAGIEKSVICSIATRVEQFMPILDWCQQIASDRIIPFPSLHPRSKHIEEEVESIAELGFKGIKMHPYYQNFILDDPALDGLYRLLEKNRLMLMMHTGFDIGYPRERRADPKRVLAVLDRFPDLRLITTHLGGWDQWDEVRELLTGKPIYMEISFALDFLDQIRIRDMIENHPPQYILFGSDSPWADQDTTLRLLKRLGLDDPLLQRIMRENALALLS
jgi:predicted TIM-barrel fold metal-dependent hydrolase